jgi:hypothetical protein
VLSRLPLLLPLLLLAHHHRHLPLLQALPRLDLLLLPLLLLLLVHKRP